MLRRYLELLRQINAEAAVVIFCAHVESKSQARSSSAWVIEYFLSAYIKIMDVGGSAAVGAQEEVLVPGKRLCRG